MITPRIIRRRILRAKAALAAVTTLPFIAICYVAYRFVARGEERRK